MNTRPDTDRPALRDGSMRQILCLLGLFGGLILFYAGGAGVQLDEVYDLQYLNDHTWYEILLTPKFGYFSLVHNIVFMAQKLLPDVPLHMFKYATGLAIEALLFILVVHTTSPFKTWFERAVFLAMSLLMLENIYDSSFWQFYLAAACLLILFSENNRRYGWKCAILLLCGLNGVQGCLLLPFFIRKWQLHHNRENAWHAAILSACMMLHIVVWKFQLSEIDMYGATRFASFEPLVYLSAIFNHMVITNFLGTPLSHIVGQKLVSVIAEMPASYLLGMITALAVFLASVLGGIRPPYSRTVLWLAAIMVLLLVFNMLTATTGYPSKIALITTHKRYFYLPTLVAVYAYLHHARHAQGKSKTLYIALLAAMLAQGFMW